MRRTLAVSILMAAGLALAACGGGGPTNGVASTPSAPATSASSAGPDDSGGSDDADPVCGEVVKVITDALNETQQEITRAATASDADVEKARQTVKQLLTDTGTKVRTAAGKAVDPELKSALDTLATEATTAANALSSRAATTALALMDRTKINQAVTKVQESCDA
jgi:hypothetical protein